MTDTVNVPREPTSEMIAAACGDREEHPVMKYLTPEERGGAAIFPLAYWRAMLSAAPKAEPVGFSVDDLAQEIRRVDGKHDLGAGALAEALMPFLRRAQPEALKEPVMVPEVFWSWLVERGLAPDAPDFDWRDIVETLNEHEDNLIERAPASDELLEALEVIQDKLKFCTDEGPEGEGWLSKELERAWGVVSDYINQHKGPQS